MIRRHLIALWVAWVGSTPLACPLDAPPPPVPIHLAGAVLRPPRRPGPEVAITDGEWRVPVRFGVRETPGGMERPWDFRRKGRCR